MSVNRFFNSSLLNVTKGAFGYYINLLIIFNIKEIRILNNVNQVIYKRA